MTASRLTPSDERTPRGFTIRPAPVREPPFDDEALHEAATWVSPTQRPLPFEPVQPPVRRRAPAISHSPRRAAVPDPAIWTRRLLIGITESAAGQRPLSQLAALVSPSVAFGLREDLAGRTAEPHWLGSARIGSLRGTEPADGVAELCATLRTPRRIHAVALRLEIHRGRWVCTKLILG